MKALSIRQPWAWLILNAGKDIENRTWWTPLRGRVFVHAAKGMTHAEYDDAVQFVVDRGLGRLLFNLQSFTQIARGGIVGSIEIVDCVRSSSSPWFCGPCGFVLREPRPLPFRPLKGALGFFDVPDA